MLIQKDLHLPAILNPQGYPQVLDLLITFVPIVCFQSPKPEYTCLVWILHKDAALQLCSYMVVFREISVASISAIQTNLL